MNYRKIVSSTILTDYIHEAAVATMHLMHDPKDFDYKVDVVVNNIHTFVKKATPTETGRKRAYVEASLEVTIDKEGHDPVLAEEACLFVPIWVKPSSLGSDNVDGVKTVCLLRPFNFLELFDVVGVNLHIVYREKNGMAIRSFRNRGNETFDDMKVIETVVKLEELINKRKVKRNE